MDEADTIAVGAVLPRLSAARPMGGYRVVVTWADGPRTGATEEVDLASIIQTHKFYAPLRDNPELFATLDLADEGSTLIWNSGGIDMAATTVQRLAHERLQTRP